MVYYYVTLQMAVVDILLDPTLIATVLALPRESQLQNSIASTVMDYNSVVKEYHESLPLKFNHSTEKQKQKKWQANSPWLIQSRQVAMNDPLIEPKQPNLGANLRSSRIVNGSLASPDRTIEFCEKTSSSS